MDAALSDLNIKIDSNVSELSDFDEIYSPMEDYGQAQISPAASAVSFSSWSFSPISGEESELHESAKRQCDADKQIVIQPIQTQVAAESGNCHQQTYSHGHQQLTQQTNISQQAATIQQGTAPVLPTMAAEYMYPSNITYRHSVNIHNYVGNYCRQSPAWKDMYAWDFPGAFTGYQPQMQHEAIEQCDPLGNLNNPELEFARCSTPEYLMALNSICQVDSPPKMSLFDESLNVNSMNSIKQDSGYNSDLNVSPVIEYQDQRSKPMTGRKHVSTPLPYPIMRFANVHKKENVPPIQRRLIPPRFTMSMPGFTPKSMYPDSQSPADSVSSTMNPVPQQLAFKHKPSPPTFQVPECSKLNFLSVADYHTKKKESQKIAENKLKRKCDSTAKLDSKTDDNDADSCTSLAKRRRHNEPLNNRALDVMQQWYLDHQNHPYPSKGDKEQLAKDGAITISQVKSWFANKRNRSNNTRPKKQKRVMEEKLLGICHQLARDAQKPNKDNAYYIQQLSSIIDTTKQ